MRRPILYASLVLLLAVSLAYSPSNAQDSLPDDTLSGDPSLPVVKFFYYDSGAVEWAVSEEPARLQLHLADEPQSMAMLESLTDAVASSPESEGSAQLMTDWLERERSRIDQSRREPLRALMAEGISAYLRAHDYGVANLVGALKRRTGATEVEVVGVHLRDAQARSSFKLKVILVNPELEIGKQGFNVRLPSDQVGYTSVAYALGVALYHVHDLLNAENEEDYPEMLEQIETLPVPEPELRPALNARVSVR